MAKILYSKQGADPTTIVWPPAGPPYERWTFVSGTPMVIHDLVVYEGNGFVTFADGRPFPPMTGMGSTFVHQKN